MDIIADLQIHSRFARACSKQINFENLEKYARIKGLNLLGTGDFQHPLWNKEIKENLKEDDNGILWSETKFPFLWQTEISLMYSQNGKRRAIHHLIFSPNQEVSNQIIDALSKKGRLDYDGRPIFGFSSIELVEMMKSINKDIEIIPAHCLVPNEKIICNPKPKSISEIKIGEKVLTHTGNYKKVIETYKRPYIGKVYSIQPYYFRDGITVTKEHPFLTIKPVKNCSYVGGLCKPNSIAKGKHKCNKKHYEDYKAEWVSAENLEVNDVLLYPRQKETNDLGSIKISDILGNKGYEVLDNFITPKIGRRRYKKIKNIVKITPSFCRLIGYYLAEGSFNKKNNVLMFSFAKHEQEYIEDVVSIMADCFGISLTKKRERYGYELYFYSKVLVELFEKLFYEQESPNRAFSKKLPDWMMYLPKSKQAEIFRGWWRGDVGVTTSEILATQMKIVCLRLGIIPSMYKMTKEKHNKRNLKISGRTIFASHDYFVFQNLSFYEDLFYLLEDTALKKFKTKLQKKHGWIDENYAYIPIKKVETNRYYGFVHNLEVEDDNSYVTPTATVHNCMTPWFGLFGSKSGFDSLKECFEEKTNQIHAIETGMSADPEMLYRLKEDINLVSFSDAHSFWPWRIGREAVIFDIPDLSSKNILNAIKTNKGLKATIETVPDYGKYHYDGHRICNIVMSPEETKKHNNICPVCKKPLTIGVAYRIEELAKAPIGYKPENNKKFYRLIPLSELIAAVYGIQQLYSKKVFEVYNKLINNFENEFNILLNVTADDLSKVIDKKLVDVIIKNRNDELKIQPGYDGEYGKIVLKEEEKMSKGQKTLAEF